MELAEVSGGNGARHGGWRRVRQGPSWRVLAILALAVLWAHTWLLRGMVLPSDPASKLEGRVLITRAILINADSGPAATPRLKPPSPATPPAPRPAAPSPPVAKPITSPPAPAESSAPTMTAAAPPAEQTAPPAPPRTDAERTQADERPPQDLPRPRRPDGPEVSHPAEPEPETATVADAGGSAALATLQIPGTTELRYFVNGRAKSLGYSANAQLQWRTDGDQYEARLEVGAFLAGSRVQTSVGRIGADGVQPRRFGNKASRAEEAAHFERERGLIVFSRNTPSAPLQPGAQDSLSVLFQLAALLGGDPAAREPGKVFTIQTAGTRDAPSWLLTVEAAETVQVDGQPLPALRVVRQPLKEFDNRVELWLSPALDWLPARIRITQSNGDFADQQLRAIPERPVPTARP